MMKIAQLTFYLLFALSICGIGCAHKPMPDPLAGWKLDLKQPDQAIEKDYQDFIHSLPPNESGYYLGAVVFYEDGMGRHAFRIETIPNNERWYHILIYDKDDKRIKHISYCEGHIQS